MRARISAPPPAAVGTTTVSGRFGHSCAVADHCEPVAVGRSCRCPQLISFPLAIAAPWPSLDDKPPVSGAKRSGRAVELAFLDDALVRLVGALDAVLAGVCLRGGGGRGRVG